MRFTTRYRFSASHRLDTPSLTPQQNRDLYGKCNNPHGHGHNYTVELTVAGPLDATGQVVNRDQLNRLVEDHVLARLDHKNMNVDVPELTGIVPTTENLAAMIQSSLERHWTLAARLVRVQISETDRNTFAWEAQA